MFINHIIYSGMVGKAMNMQEKISTNSSTTKFVKRWYNKFDLVKKIDENISA